MSNSDKLFRPEHLAVQWHITDRCNWHCKHCYQERYLAPEMSLEKLQDILDQILMLLKKWRIPKSCAKIQITGGEPFLRQDFLRFLAKIHKASPFFHRLIIMSNGSLLTKEIVKILRLFEVTALQLSLEGMEKNNDEIRGEGTFQKTLGAAELLKWAGIQTIISLTLTKKNRQDIKPLAKLLASPKFNITRLGVRRIVPIGAGEQLKELILEPEELRAAYKELEEINKIMLKNNLRLRVAGGCENAIFNDEISNPDIMSYNNCGITDGRIIVIMPNGDVLACRRLPIKIGSLNEKRLEEIYYSPIYEKLRNGSDLNTDSPCNKCSNFQNCFGGAKCVTYALTGKTTPDVQCWKLYNNLHEALNKIK